MPFGKGIKKKPAASYSRTGESRTTLGDGALDFRVRNGNGYDNSSMATGKKPIENCSIDRLFGLFDSTENPRSWELKRITARHEMRVRRSHI